MTKFEPKDILYIGMMSDDHFIIHNKGTDFEGKLYYNVCNIYNGYFYTFDEFHLTLITDIFRD